MKFDSSYSVASYLCNKMSSPSDAALKIALLIKTDRNDFLWALHSHIPPPSFVTCLSSCDLTCALRCYICVYVNACVRKLVLKTLKSLLASLDSTSCSYNPHAIKMHIAVGQKACSSE